MNNQHKLGPNGKLVRPYVLPSSLWGKVYAWRYMLYRRATQLGVLILFIGSAHWGWSLFDSPILRGNLSASEFLGFIPLADPFAALQIFLTAHVLEADVIIGASIIFITYLLLGRVWCSWVCPINMITDLASWLRRKLKIPSLFHLPPNFKYVVLALSLVLSVLTGTAAFEWVSPISIVHRELIFGIGIGWTVIIGIFLLDLFIMKHGWCGRLCPLGAFYSLLGKLSPLRISFDKPSCTHCLECVHVCPEPQVLNFKKAGKEGFINFGECSNCGRCISVCPEESLQFNLKHLIKTSETENILIPSNTPLKAIKTKKQIKAAQTATN